VSSPAGRPDGTADSLGVRAARRAGGAALDDAVLDGEACYVVDGHVADVLIVAARDDAGIGLFAVRGDAPGLDRTVLPAIDGTRKLARLQFRSVPARLLGAAGSGAAALGRVLDVAVTALAAEAVGGAEEMLDLALSHARQRVQFGRPIGSFQAVKHKCAELFVVLEGARVALDGALRAAAGLESGAEVAQSSAVLFGGPPAHRAALADRLGL
jgi:alkylation response protein AidB-like acyl-CoA dehydrogenase